MLPSLLVLVMELFTYIMHKSLSEGKYKIHYKCEDPAITHLYFTDELTTFLRGDLETTTAFNQNLQMFGVALLGS